VELAVSMGARVGCRVFFFGL